MCSCKKQSERQKNLKVTWGWPYGCAPSVSFQVCGNSLKFGTARRWMFECNISMKSASLWNTLNFNKEWVRTSWPHHMCSFKKQSERLKSFRFAAGWPCAQFGMSATFQCSAHPFETFWIFTRNEWGPADHIHICIERPKSLRVAVGWPFPQAFLSKEWGNMLLHINISVQYFNVVHAPFKR